MLIAKTKKILKWVGVSILGLFLLILIIPELFESQIADIVKIAGNFCQLHGAFVVAHGLENITGHFRHVDHVGKTMFCETQGAQRFVRPDDISLDGFAVGNFFVGEHTHTSFWDSISQKRQKNSLFTKVLQSLYQ